MAALISPKTVDDFVISNCFSPCRVLIFYFSDHDINNVEFKWTQKKLLGEGEFADVSFFFSVFDM